MAKRGETRPWRMTYRWEHGISGTEAFPTRERAEAAAAAQRARLGPDGETCQATVAHRDEPRRACLDCPKRAQPGSPWCAEHD